VWLLLDTVSTPCNLSRDSFYDTLFVKLPLREVEHVDIDVLAVLALEHHPQLALAGDQRVLGAVLVAEGVPVSDGYEMPLYRQPAFFRNEIGRLLPDGTTIPDYRNRHLPGVEEICRTNVSYSHTVLLAEEEGVRSIPTAIRKIQNNTDELLE
jgi:hypothetical protein